MMQPSFVPPSGPCPSTIMIVGEAPDERAVHARTPFAGPAGDELNRMLSEAGMMRSNCFCTYVIRERPRRMILPSSSQ